MLRTCALGLLVIACGSDPESSTNPKPDSSVANDGGTEAGTDAGPDASEEDASVDAAADSSVDAPEDSSTTLVPGTLEVTWMHGSASCASNTDPEVQVHAYNATTHIIRQNKCKTFEAPFIYVLEGTQSALSLDTGATTTSTLATTVRGLVPSQKPILAAHTHAHGDHVAGDSQFAAQPNVTVVGKTVAAVQAAFGITNWPTDVGTLDLGDRVLDVIAIPGHQTQHIAIYDRQTGLFFTGDSLYPGLLFINDWATYRTSMHRMALFAAAHPIAHVLGAHIEMSSTPKIVYPYGTTYQPEEHVLELTAAHATELDTALTDLGPVAPTSPVAHDDFVIDPQ